MSGYRLVRLSGSYGPDEWPLAPRRQMVIGRQDAAARPDVDLAPDRTVSRRHAQIWFDSDSWWIRDLNSKAGTTLGAYRIPANIPMRCEPGVAIRVGRTELAIFDPTWHRLRYESLVIEIGLRSTYSYTLALSGLGLLTRLAVRHWGDTPSARGRLDLSLAALAHATVDVPRLACGEARTLAPPTIEIDEKALITRSEHAWLPLSVQLNGHRVDRGKVGCSVLAYNEWSYEPEHRPSLAAFVLREHPSVVQMAREAAAGLSLRTGSAAVLQRLYEHLSTSWRIDYRKDRPSTEAATQKLRLAGDVLWDPVGQNGEGTCIDIALLIAAGLETFRLHPLIALIDRGKTWHAIVGCWHATRQRLELLPADREALTEEAIWVDPNGCTRDPPQRVDFTGAAARARRDLTERPLLFALDIAVARASGIHPLPLTVDPRGPLTG
jgi:hypothetical protein